MGTNTALVASAISQAREWGLDGARLPFAGFDAIEGRLRLMRSDGIVIGRIGLGSGEEITISGLAEASVAASQARRPRAGQLTVLLEEACSYPRSIRAGLPIRPPNVPARTVPPRPFQRDPGG